MRTRLRRRTVGRRLAMRVSSNSREISPVGRLRQELCAGSSPQRGTHNTGTHASWRIAAGRSPVTVARDASASVARVVDSSRPAGSAQQGPWDNQQDRRSDQGTIGDRARQVSGNAAPVVAAQGRGQRGRQAGRQTRPVRELAQQDKPRVRHDASSTRRSSRSNPGPPRWYSPLAAPPSTQAPPTPR